MVHSSRHPGPLVSFAGNPLLRYRHTIEAQASPGSPGERFECGGVGDGREPCAPVADSAPSRSVPAPLHSAVALSPVPVPPPRRATPPRSQAAQRSQPRKERGTARKLKNCRGRGEGSGVGWRPPPTRALLRAERRTPPRPPVLIPAAGPRDAQTRAARAGPGRADHAGAGTPGQPGLQAVAPPVPSRGQPRPRPRVGEQVRGRGPGVTEGRNGAERAGSRPVRARDQWPCWFSCSDVDRQRRRSRRGREPGRSAAQDAMVSASSRKGRALLPENLRLMRRAGVVLAYEGGIRTAYLYSKRRTAPCGSGEAPLRGDDRSALPDVQLGRRRSAALHGARAKRCGLLRTAEHEQQGDQHGSHGPSEDSQSGTTPATHAPNVSI